MVDDRSRQQRVSVAIVDYDMPKMTGVEFCRAIPDLPVKTILLTGKAGLETAISAFNEGVIDCFLQKQDASVSASLRREIKRLQDEYFAEISSRSKARWRCRSRASSPTQLHRAVQRGVGEEQSRRALRLRGAARRDDARRRRQRVFLLISDVEAVKSQCEVAENQRAPPDMVQLLRTRKAHAWFPTNEGLYHPDFEARLGALHLAGAAASGVGRVELQLHSPRAPVEETFHSQSA